MPIGNFVKRVPAQRVGYINRVDGNRVMTVTANVAEGVQAAKVQEEITAELGRADLGFGVTCKLKGEDEERDKAGAFLVQGIRHRDLPDLRDPAGAVQQADLGRARADAR